MVHKPRQAYHSASSGFLRSIVGASQASLVPKRAYSASRRSGLPLEGLCIVAPHTVVRFHVAFASHTDLGGLQQADAGCRDNEVGSCFIGTYVAHIVFYNANASSQLVCTVVSNVQIG